MERRDELTACRRVSGGEIVSVEGADFQSALSFHRRVETRPPFTQAKQPPSLYFERSKAHPERAGRPGRSVLRFLCVQTKQEKCHGERDGEETAVANVHVVEQTESAQ